MTKLLLGTVAAFALTATPAFAQNCNDPDLEQDIKGVFAQSHNLDGLSIIDFEDGRETSGFPPNGRRVTVLRCKATEQLSDSTYHHLICNREVQDTVHSLLVM